MMDRGRKREREMERKELERKEKDEVREKYIVKWKERTRS